MKKRKVPDDSKLEQIVLRITHDLYTKFRVIAAIRNVSVGSLTEEIVKEFVTKNFNEEISKLK